MSELNELIASEIADFFAGFGGPGEPDVQSGEAQRLLTERLLTVLALRERAEPVGEVVDQPDGLVMDGTVHLGGSGTHRAIKGLNKMKRMPLGTKFYTAPPAPVVLRERAEPVAYAEPQAFRNFQAGTANKGWMWAHPYAGLVPVFVEAPPAPVAAGWIACSERLPEVGDIVLTADNGCVNVGEMERSGASCRYFTSVVSGRELPATHWMPLPEAPTKN
ncbi:DUF551 domain-containing protein [Cronobacter sakazakii]|uniref:DUF551 domain-containing protein n=1 Tax=Cronobacter sakazakii TaxID=28141 RepID=UPI000622C312|nr:DUF551 domain-containing protein [Cronobacter sakazakii]AKE95046.1 hypothetical protein CSK29544_02089 [Cronobacter sakazakii]MDK1211967.1 DUF551 domain-containing protein [Cronobacter sakazakii]SPW12881.1 Protein of uncharacterised function (DUF551) [Cronobacter sakazakii]